MLHFVACGNGDFPLQWESQERRLMPVLQANIKTLRKAKGLSQEELAVKLHVVRQTISKWEKGLSVPDSDMLFALSEALEAPVSTLLGEAVPEQETDELKAISEKLEVINLRFARQKAARRRAVRCLLLAPVRGHRAPVRGAAGMGQPLPGLGLQRSRAGRGWGGPPRLRVAVCPGGADHPGGGAPGPLPDTETGIASQSAPFDLFRASPAYTGRGGRCYAELFPAAGGLCRPVLRQSPGFPPGAGRPGQPGAAAAPAAQVK